MALTQLAKKYIVQLTKDERLYLESLIYKGKVAAHKRLHAEILLKADISELSASASVSLVMPLRDAVAGH